MRFKTEPCNYIFCFNMLIHNYILCVFKIQMMSKHSVLACQYVTIAYTF